MQLSILGAEKISANKEQLAKFKHWLIFGSDNGQIKIIVDKLVKAYSNNKNTNLLRYDNTNLKGDISKLYSALSIADLFGGKTIVILDYANEFQKELENILQNRQLQGLLIILAAELKKDSKIRKIAETSNYIGAVNCYKKEDKDILAYIKCYLTEHKIYYEPLVPELILQALPKNNLIIQNELDKLIEYKVNTLTAAQKIITVDDVNNIIVQEGDVALNKICRDVIIGDVQSFVLNFNKACSNHINFMLILRTLQNYLYQVLELKILMKQKNNNQSYISKEQWQMLLNQSKKQIFGTAKDEMLEILTNIKLEKIQFLLQSLLIVEIESKKQTYSKTELIVESLLTNIVTNALY